MIRFENVCKHYPGGIRALDALDFSIDAGELVFLTGHSGAGKSTLLRLLMMLERPTRGQVVVAGRNLGQAPDRAAPRVRQGMGVVFQDHRLLADKRVGDNVALPLLIAGLRYDEVRKRVRAALDKVGLLDRERAWPRELSGGEQQRVGIARAIVARPPLLLADEPTGNLDPELSWELFGLFAEVNQAGTTVLIASHDLALVRRMARRVLVLAEGRLVDDIPGEAIGGGQA